ncbi:MAG: hypothetical protein ACKVH8_11945 [Pirellulales bacterium]
MAYQDAFQISSAVDNNRLSLAQSLINDGSGVVIFNGALRCGKLTLELFVKYYIPQLMVMMDMPQRFTMPKIYYASLYCGVH